LYTSPREPILSTNISMGLNGGRPYIIHHFSKTTVKIIIKYHLKMNIFNLHHMKT